MFLLFYRLFCGYLYVRATAQNPEKLLNLCAAKGIPLWRVSVKGEKLYFKIGISSFKRLRIFKRNIPCKIHITKKAGLPFFIHKNKKRYGFLAGIILFFVILNLMSGYGWNICISGNKDVKSADIKASLKQIGIYEGVKISNIDPEVARNELLLKRSDLSWAAINIEGSKITVDVVETKKPDATDTAPSNLISTDDGIIKKIEVKHGVSMVKVGDTVESGQLLVSGVKEYDDLSVEFEKSMGNIYAEVNYEFTVSQPFKVTEYVKTGEKQTKRLLNVFGLNIPLYFGSQIGSYEATPYFEKVSSGQSYLPISIIKKTFYKTQKITHTLSYKTALLRCEDRVQNKITDLVNGGEILNKQITEERQNESVVLKVKLTCIKDITFEEKLRLDTSNSN